MQHLARTAALAALIAASPAHAEIPVATHGVGELACSTFSQTANKQSLGLFAHWLGGYATAYNHFTFALYANQQKAIEGDSWRWSSAPFDGIDGQMVEYFSAVRAVCDKYPTYKLSSAAHTALRLIVEQQ